MKEAFSPRHSAQAVGKLQLFFFFVADSLVIGASYYPRQRSGALMNIDPTGLLWFAFFLPCIARCAHAQCLQDMGRHRLQRMYDNAHSTAHTDSPCIVGGSYDE